MRIKLRAVEIVVGGAALALGITGTIFSYNTQTQDKNQVSCQTRINQEFLTVLKERATIGNENTENLNNFIVSFINSANYTKAQDAAVIKTYLTELATINGDLKNATYPDIGHC